MTSVGLESFKALLLAASLRQREIKEDISKAKSQLLWARTLQALGWASLVSAAIKPIRKSAERAVSARRNEITTLKANLEATPISVDFDMDSEAALPHARMQDSFGLIAGCHRTWSVKSTQRIDSVKARTLAGTVVNRKLASLGWSADRLVATRDPPLALGVQDGRAVAYFYPGFVLVAAKSGGEFGLIDILELDVRARTSYFNETESVPRDTVIVGHTWAKCNKDGSRDRRFANNSQIPVVEYGDLTLKGPGGFNESLMTSSARPCHDFASAVSEMQRVLSCGKAARKVAGRQSMTDGR
jgi:hypothetical protein